MLGLRESSAFLVCFGLATLALLLPRVFPRARWIQRLPPPLWCYALPMVLKGSGLVSVSPDFLQRVISVILPTALFLTLLPTPLAHLWSVGPKALLAMLAGSFGIVAGGQIVFGLFQAFLPPDGWRPLALLSATWIGGSLNMLAVREALQIPESLLGPMILVDSFITYSWFAFLLFLIPYQPTLNRWFHARPLFFKKIGRSAPQPPTSPDNRWCLLGVIAVQTFLCIATSRVLPPFLGLSQKTWGLLLATLLALILSPLRWIQQEQKTEAQWGQFLLFLVLAALGFQGDVRAFLKTPIYLLVGIVWVAFHAGILLLVGRVLRLPLGLLATASQANIGGVVSTPLVGAAYDPNLVSVGLLLAILGNVIGTPLGLASAFLMRQIAQMP